MCFNDSLRRGQAFTPVHLWIGVGDLTPNGPLELLASELCRTLFGDDLVGNARFLECFIDCAEAGRPRRWQQLFDNSAAKCARQFDGELVLYARVELVNDLRYSRDDIGVKEAVIHSQTPRSVHFECGNLI